MSRRSANGMLRRKLFNIQSNPDSAAAPYPNTAPRSSKHDFTAAPYPSTAAGNSRQSVTTALIDSRAATLPERGGLFCCENRCYRNRTVRAENVAPFERAFCVFPRNLAPAFTHYLR